MTSPPLAYLSGDESGERSVDVRQLGADPPQHLLEGVGGAEQERPHHLRHVWEEGVKVHGPQLAMVDHMTARERLEEEKITMDIRTPNQDTQSGHPNRTPN